jgi:molybdenum cofactor biosynthesis enzyme MoaA
MDIGINQKCNNNCIMCTNVMPYKNNQEFKFKDLINIIKNSRENNIIITGCKPTLRRDLIKILRNVKLSKPNVEIILITNARFFL